MHGRYKIREYEAGTNKLISVSDWIENKIVASTNYGLNLILQNLGGDHTYLLEITQAKIGTGTNAPAESDTDLQTPVVSGITRASQVVGVKTLTIDFFIADALLPNGNYNEFGLFCSNQLFARSLISPTYTKTANKDTKIEYEITFNN